jgi:integrase/recombinase XerD
MLAELKAELSLAVPSGRAAQDAPAAAPQLVRRTHEDQEHKQSAVVVRSKPRSASLELGVVVDRHMEWLEERAYAESTRRQSESLLRALVGFARRRGFSEWREIGPATLKAFVVGDSDRSALRRFFRYLVRRGIPSAAALAWLSPPRESRRREVPAAIASSPLRADVLDYIDHKRMIRRLQEATLKGMQVDLERFIGWIAATGPTSWGSVTTEHVDAFLQREAADGASIRQSLKTRGSLKGLWYWLADRGLRRDDWALVAPPPRLDYRIPDVLTQAEVDELLADPWPRDPIGLRDRAIIELLYASGVRNAELRGLRVPDLDLDERLARVAGKGSAERLVVFGRPAAEALREYLERGRGALESEVRTDHVFLSQLGGSLSSVAVTQLLHRRARAVGLARRVYPHLMRHTCATHLLRGGADLRFVQELLGHAHIKTTEIYTHLDARYSLSVHGKFHPRENTTTEDK